MKKRLLSWLMALTLCLTLLPATALAAEATPAAQTAGTHEHFLCGGAECNKEGHELEEGGMTTFEPWNKDATTTGGAYYLTGNIGGFTVPDGVDLTLCLNGYNITSANQGEDVITVKPGATFTLCDCKHGSTTGYGTIGHNNPSQYNGSGVTVAGDESHSGTFNMYGGKIANNTVGYHDEYKTYGGGVLVFNKGIFNMIGGEITGNRATYGGGVSVGTAYGLHGNTDSDIGGTFNMTGGEIYGNFCASDGGGVHACASSKLHFTVSGSAQIKDNYTGDLFSSMPAQGKDNNVYLEKYTNEDTGETIMATITVNGTLTGSIGVNTDDVDHLVATGVVSKADAKRFTSDNSKTYRLKYDSSESTLTMISAAHSAHPICGDASCEDSGHVLPDGKSWTAISDLSAIKSEGYYYLTDDVELTDTWTPKDGVVLCLNGYSITMNSTGYAVWVNQGYTFTLCDCVGGGKITHGEGADGRGVYVVGTFNMYGGSISGNRAQHGSGVCLDNGGKGTVFNMYGGEITGNTATSSGGGGVYVNIKSTFNMYGGSITDNLNTTKDNYGGGVYVSQDGTFTVSGKVNITGNKHKGDKGSNDSNVFLPFGDQGLKSFTIGKDGLTSDSSIGVATNVAPNPGVYLTVATLSEGAAYTDGTIISDRTGDYVIKRKDNNINLYNGLPHEHYRCNGKNGDEDVCTGIGHTEDGVLSFEPWTNTTKLPTTSGHYYLKQDVTLESTWSIQGTSGNMVAIVLCLNGHSIQLKDTSSSTDVIRINEHATLALCDCNGSGKNNGIITGGTKASGVNITNNGAFVMYGGSISGNGIGVNNGQRFYMYGGSITGNDRGVYVNSTDFTVAGDVKITNNNTNGNVYLPSGKTITVGGALTGGAASIGVTTKSTIAEGNYITVAKGGSGYNTLTEDDLSAFTSDAGYDKRLNGNSVVFTNGDLHTHAVCGKENCADSHDTAIYMPLTYNAATMTLYCGGKAVESDDYPILAGTDENDNKKYIYYMEYRLPAGNYYLADDIALNGGTANGKTYVGGLIRIKGYDLNVNLCLNGKTLSATNPNTHLLYASMTQTLTLSDCKGGGTIRTDAGGYNVLYVSGDKDRSATFTMYGGTISGARTGVWTLYGAFNMFGGTITGNECGLDIGSNSSVTVGGTVNITGNTEKNLYLYTGSKTGAIISIDATLTQASRIGITTGTAPTAEKPIKIATGANGSVDYTKIFTPDVKNKGYVVTRSEDGTLSLGVHQHSWRYTADEATITATCENTDGGCSLKSDEYVGGTATLKAPEPSVYDGKSKKATVVYDTAWNANVGSGSAKMEYYQNDTKAANVINAGIYTAKLWIDDSQSVPAELTFAIARKAPKVGDFTFKTLTNLFYDGTVKSAEVELVSNKNYSGCGEISATYYDAQGNKVEPKAPGTYTVKISVGDTGENFKATTADLENKDWTFTIGKGTQTITVPEGKTIINNNVAVDISGWATATGIAGGATAGEVSYALVDQPTGVTLNGTELSVASVKADTKITVKATAAGTDYYNETAQTFTVTVVNKTSTKLNVEQAKWTYGEKSKDPQFDKPESTLDDTIKVTYAAKKADGTNGTFEAKAPVNAGSYTVKVQYETVDHIYTGTADFTIDPKSISKAEFTLDSTKQIYDNTAKTPAVSDVKVDGTVLTENTDYTVSYTNNTDAGTATVTITGVGNYKDSVSEGFTIQQGNDPTYAVPQNLKATYGQTLAEVNLPTGWTWDDDSLSVGNATGDSTRGFKATYTPENKNYKTVTGIDVYVKVNKAAGRDLGSSTYKQRFTDGMEQQIALSWEGLPDGQTWSYNSSVRNEDVDKLNGQHTLLATGETLGYTLNTNKAKAGDTIVFTLTASCSNYEDFTYTITVNITDRDAQSVQFENGLTEKTVTYGDANFTVKATAKTAITYRSSNFAVAEVNATTGEVTIKGAGVVTITAEAAQSDVYAGDSAFYTLTVKPMPIPAPKADERTFTYNGEAQTYTLKENEDYYTITGNEETNANENGYTVTVALKDTTNTCWDDKTTNAKTYSFVIRKAVVTVNALNKTAYVGDKAAPDLSNPELDKDYTVSGLVGKDKLDGNVTLSYDPTPDMSKTGELAIKFTGTLANDNYTINYADGKLSITNRPSSGGGSYTPTYPVSTPSKTENGSVSSNVKNASKGDTVTITVKPDSGYVLDDLTVTDKNGNELKLNDKGNGKYTFTMPAGKVEVKASFAEAVETSPFADVETNAYYYEAVKWAADKGITGGIGNSLFGPNQPCTRAQIVTFLWRAAGSPEPKGTAAGMTDVVSGSYYEKAVAWAIENGVTTGTTASTFSPNATCTRAQAVTFLARALSAKATSAAEFSDVPTNSYFAEAVAWAAANSVTEGVGNGLFAPHNNCTRAQIVTFLYRAYNK